MSSMISTGVSGLMAFQTALNTTSHNISNSSTAGFSRQSVDLSAARGQYTGIGWIGSGVDVNTVQRSYSDLIATQVRSSSSAKSQWESFTALTDEVNNMFGDSSTGLSTNLQSFFNAFQSVANSPASSSERQVLLSQAQILVNQIQAYSTRLQSLEQQNNSQLVNETSTINGLAQSIAVMNQQISAVTARGGNAPNDMLDQRDALIDELATHVNISTVRETNGAISVFIGTGQSLVVNTEVASMVVGSDAYDVSRATIMLQSNGAGTDITNSLTGGATGGLLAFRSQVLDPAINTLGRTAVTLSELVNNQQNAGMDMYGALGADMFSVGAVKAMASSRNTGTADASVVRSDVSAMSGDDYVLTYSGSAWSLTNARTSASVAMTGAGTLASPFVAEGLSITLSGVPAAGDRIQIKPFSAAVSGLSVAMTDTGRVAAAAPIIGSASSNNTGTASITQGVVTDPANAQLRTTTTVRFVTPTSYTTDGGVTTNAYTSGQTINLNGWQVSIRGTPAAGDVFTVQDNSGGTGDNRNALLMANLLNKDYLTSGPASLNDLVGRWVADIGVKSSQAQSSLSIQSALYEDNINAQQSESGVNLDEEAANLVRYQQAYAAAAQVISTANKLFDSLLDAVR